MSRLVLVCRLAARDMQRHVTQAALLLLVVTGATTVLTLGLALNGVTSQPYQQTQAATRGPDVIVNFTDQVGTNTSRGQYPVAKYQAMVQAESRHLYRASGVTAYSGPFPIASATVRVNGLTAAAEVEGRTQPPAAVDQPKLTAGSWVRPGGVVIERTFAEALGLGVGDHVSLNGKSFTVAGIAVTAANPPYPNLCYPIAGGCGIYLWNNAGQRQVGLIWSTEPDAWDLSPSSSNPMTNYFLDLKLSSPAATVAFMNQNSNNNTPFSIASWQNIAKADALLVQDEQSVLAPGAVLLGLLAIATVAVLVGSRLAEHTRRVGLLKAAGATPSLVAATFLAENLVLALVAAAAGLAIGWLAAPLLTNPGAALIGTPGAPSLTVTTIIEVVAVALAVALASTLVPAIRAARSSTVAALADAGRAPRRGTILIRISRTLPVAVLFGLRLAGRRPRRAVLSAASIAVTVAGIVAVLAFHATVNTKVAGTSLTGLPNPVVSRDEQMLLVITVILAIMAALNTIFTAWATVLDAKRASALMRALGASSGQVSVGLMTAQVLSALPGAIVGVPLGIGLFFAANTSGSQTPPVIWTAAAVVGILAVVAGLTTIPAMMSARIPAPQILQSETA
jgi:putative ABC transport system permease protein